MATVDYALTTRQKVKDFLNIQDTGSDPIIDALINSVSSFIERYCGGRRFLATDYVEIKDTYNSANLFFNQRPVNSVTAVEYRTGVPSAPVWMTYNANGYLVYLGEGFIRFFTKFSPMPQAFRLSYNAGYLIDWAHETDAELHTLPMDLTQVATEIVAKTINTRYAQGISQESTEGQSITYEKGRNELTQSQKTVLDAYKMNRVAP